MNQKALKSLKKHKKSNFVKIEYLCEECGNIVFRTLTNEEIKELLSKYNKFEPIICEICYEEKMTIHMIISEKEFYRDDSDFMSGI